MGYIWYLSLNIWSKHLPSISSVLASTVYVSIDKESIHDDYQLKTIIQSAIWYRLPAWMMTKADFTCNSHATKNAFPPVTV